MKKTISKRVKKVKNFYILSLTPQKERDIFYPEYVSLSKTVEAVNSFRSLYQAGRKGILGGPSTSAQQDLYRAMLVFACSGLDVFVKQLIKTKLPELINVDQLAINKFKDYVKKGLKRNEAIVLNTIALALIDQNPRAIFLSDYIESLSGDSLQSVSELCKVSEASGLDTENLVNKKEKSLKETFGVRNQIIHEMDINTTNKKSGTTGFRTRKQRVAKDMEKHTKNILDFATDLFNAYKEKFDKYQIGKEKVPIKN